mmetsp:Transcript_23406/g.25960  ORF Transcript_23406/g.25960 Transcript_23406/m.25960 type:complete len:446 (-) Transcript_23406:10-1347(-)
MWQQEWARRRSRQVVEMTLNVRPPPRNRRLGRSRPSPHSCAHIVVQGRDIRLDPLRTAIDRLQSQLDALRKEAAPAVGAVPPQPEEIERYTHVLRTLHSMPTHPPNSPHHSEVEDPKAAGPPEELEPEEGDLDEDDLDVRHTPGTFVGAVRVKHCAHLDDVHLPICACVCEGVARFARLTAHNKCYCAREFNTELEDGRPFPAQWRDYARSQWNWNSGKRAAAMAGMLPMQTPKKFSKASAELSHADYKRIGKEYWDTGILRAMQRSRDAQVQVLTIRNALREMTDEVDPESELLPHLWRILKMADTALYTNLARGNELYNVIRSNVHKKLGITDIAGVKHGKTIDALPDSDYALVEEKAIRDTALKDASSAALSPKVRKRQNSRSSPKTSKTSSKRKDNGHRGTQSGRGRGSYKRQRSGGRGGRGGRGARGGGGRGRGGRGRGR